MRTIYLLAALGILGWVRQTSNAQYFPNQSYNRLHSNRYHNRPYYSPYTPTYYSPPVIYYPPGTYYGSLYLPGYTQVSPATTTVGVSENYFDPRRIRITPGTTVKWVNYGRHAHTVESDDGRWKSGNLQPGESFTYTFNQVGVYYYRCRHHDGMRGTIEVMSKQP